MHYLTPFPHLHLFWQGCRRAAISPVPNNLKYIMSSLRDIMDVDVEPLPQTLSKPTREHTIPDDTTADQLTSPTTKEEHRDDYGKAPIKRRRSNRSGLPSAPEASSSKGESSAVTDTMDPHHQYGSGSHRHTSVTSSTRHSSRGSDVAEGSIKYTPVTGRVSRAKKGQPVHVCEICKPSKVNPQNFCLLSSLTAR